MSGVDVVVHLLRVVDRHEGSAAAMEVAREMAAAAAAIFAREYGRRSARRMLKQIAQVLPDRR
jgi:hypothetical protein